MLVGPPGVGKTTSARTVTDSLRAPVHWAACTESSRAIPLGAFAPWVRLSPSTSRDPIAALVSAREALIAEPNTARSRETVPDAITTLWKDGYLTRIELDPLTKEQCTELVEKVLGGTLEGLSADVIWESSGGNPLFLRNMVEGALAAGNLTENNEVWQLRGPTAVPSGLVALIDERLDRAGDAVVDALKLLALYEPLDLDTLVELGPCVHGSWRSCVIVRSPRPPSGSGSPGSASTVIRTSSPSC